MQKPLKKQIFQVKVSNFIKTHSVILFFAIFDLTQKQRGELKNQINLIINKSLAEHGKDFKLQAAVPSIEKESYNFSSSLKQLRFVTLSTLHLSNKCFQNFTKEKSEQLPLYGQTLIIAFRHEDDLVFFSTFLSLYNGILLGGLYKNKPQTKNYLTALCKKTQKKSEVYKACLNVLAVTSRNLQKTTSAPAMNLMRLLIHISKPSFKVK